MIDRHLLVATGATINQQHEPWTVGGQIAIDPRTGLVVAAIMAPDPDAQRDLADALSDFIATWTGNRR